MPSCMPRPPPPMPTWPAPRSAWTPPGPRWRAGRPATPICAGACWSTRRAADMRASLQPVLTLLLALSLGLAAPAASAASTSEHEQAVAGLRAELGTLDGDPSLARLGRVERLKARQ